MDLSTEKYPAKDHAKRVANAIRARGHGSSGVIYLESQKTSLMEDSDEPVPFRQRRNFFYLSGCPLPDSYLAYNIEKHELILFIPPVDPEAVIWSGLPLSPVDALKLYDVDAVLPTTELNAHLAHCCSGENGAKKVFAISNQVSPETTFLSFQDTDFESLKLACEECRVIKDKYEIALLRQANEVSGKGHVAAMKATKVATNEREFEAAFVASCMANGCRRLSYPPIFASGTSAATLHYEDNSAELVDSSTGSKRLNLLMDAGGEYRTYCADITRTFPLSGKFSPESRSIYDIVLEMHTKCLNMMKPGMMWDDAHENAHRVAVDGLLQLGILLGSKEEILDKGISVAFFPHGLGHHLGMDTHDVGGNPNFADENPMFKNLRLRGRIPEGAVVTVEPGVYFCRFIIEPYLKSPELRKYINVDVLDRYWSVGGVRIEDNIVITDGGHENLTTVPKTVDEVEHLVQT